MKLFEDGIFDPVLSKKKTTIQKCEIELNCRKLDMKNTTQCYERNGIA